MPREFVKLRSRDELIAAIKSAGNDGRELSYGEVARRAGCSKAMIGFLAKGTHDRVAPARGAEIERALGVDTGTLFAPESQRVTA